MIYDHVLTSHTLKSFSVVAYVAFIYKIKQYLSVDNPVKLGQDMVSCAVAAKIPLSLLKAAFLWILGFVFFAMVHRLAPPASWQKL